MPGEVPAGAILYTAATPQLWVLMRVFAQSRAEVTDARRFQDEVAVTQTPGGEPARGRSAPAGPFFVAIPSYLPKPEALDERWLPDSRALSRAK